MSDSDTAPGTQTELDRLRRENADLRGGIKQAEQQLERLRTSQQRLELYYQTAQDAIVVHQRGALLDANDAFYALFGYQKSDLAGADLIETLFPVETRAKLCERMASNALEPFEATALDQSGAILTVKIITHDVIWQGRPARAMAIHDLTAIRAAEQLQQSNLRLLENLERIDRVIRQTSDLEALMSGLLEEMLEIFGSDRAWLLFPCDPDAPDWSVPMERTRPDFPGALAVGAVVPMDPAAAATFTLARESKGPICYDPRSKRPLPQPSSEMFQIRSQIVRAIYPRTGHPWLLGMHQCAHTRVWSDEDVTLFNEIGRRIADGLSGMLSYNRVRESERQFKSLVANLPGVVFRCQHDADWTMNFVSAGIETLLGFPAEDFIANRKRSFTSVIHPDDRNSVAEKISASLAARKPYEIEYRLLDRDGRVLWATQRGQGVFDEEGRLLYLDGVIFNISERKVAEQEILRLRHLLADIIDSMPSALIGVDANGRVTQWNQEAEGLSGLSTQQALGENLDTLLPELAHQLPVHALRPPVAPLTQQRIDWTQEEGERAKEITIFPLSDTAPPGAVIRIDDIHDRLRMEEALIQTEKMLSVGTLAAGMAHEINNPLAAIGQSLQVALQRLDGGNEKNRQIAAEVGVPIEALNAYAQRRKLDQLLKTAVDSCRRAAQIVENMFSFSRKSSSTQLPQALPALIEQAINLAANDFSLRERYDFRNIRIERDYAADLPEPPGDHNQLKQVFLNLFINGAHAMAERHASLPEDQRCAYQPRFQLRLRYDAEQVRVEVEDNGVGMSPEVCKRIFEPFFTTKEVGRGTGLGLSVAYFIIIEFHRGRMRLRSAPGQGSCFIIELPR